MRVITSGANAGVADGKTESLETMKIALMYFLKETDILQDRASDISSDVRKCKRQAQNGKLSGSKKKTQRLLKHDVLLTVCVWAAKSSCLSALQTAETTPGDTAHTPQADWLQVQYNPGATKYHASMPGLSSLRSLSIGWN